MCHKSTKKTTTKNVLGPYDLFEELLCETTHVSYISSTFKRNNGILQ